MPPVPNAIRVTCKLDLLGGEVSTNVWATNKAGLPNPITLAEGQDIADAFEPFYGNLSTGASPARGIKEFLPDHAQLTQITVHDIEDNVKFDYAYSEFGSDNDSAPYESAAVISLISATSGRKGRGRIFVGPLGLSAIETAFVSGRPPHLTAAARTAFLAATFDLNARLQALVPPRDLCMISMSDLAVRPIVTARADDELDNQVRRKSELTGSVETISL